MTLEDLLSFWFPGLQWASWISISSLLLEIITFALPLLLIVGSFVYTFVRFRRNTFYDVVTFSLNTFDPPSKDGEKIALRFRTQMEGCIEDFIPKNTHLSRAIRKAAQRCNFFNMFMKVGGGKRTQEMFLNALSSHWVAQESAEGDLGRLMGLPTKHMDFWLGVTFEPYESPSARKIRVMIVSEEDMHNQTFHEDDYVFEQTSHKDRIHTLWTMRNIFNNSTDCGKYLVRRTITKLI